MPPVQSCEINGKMGYKWGESGKCYTGHDAKEKAEKQGKAIIISRQKQHSKSYSN